LAQRNRELASRGQRLVFTNGCFDLLHVGHVRYLTQARALGDALAIGLNSDDSIRRLKSAGRPVTPESERAEILAALDCVNYVSIFDEDTARDIISDVRPAIYCKGGDWSSDPASDRFPSEAQLVLSYGGQLRILSFVEGHSTSDMIERLQRGS
jgi:rfaE bifunctional protein nucleotidyltransferase chain/domain